MDTTLTVPPVSTARFIDGNKLIATPSLDMAAGCEPGELIPLLEKLVHYFVAAGLLPLGSFAEILLLNDEGTESFDEILTLEELDSLQLAFQKASAKAIRRLPCTLVFTERNQLDTTNLFSKTLRLTVGCNFFPDELVAISVCLHSCAASAWADLAAIKNGLVEVLGQSFYYATLGYAFAYNPSDIMKVSAQIENVCMRYLGADLYDPFGSFVQPILYGMRSVNWEVTFSEYALQNLLPAERSAIETGAVRERNALTWKTGAEPSLCDRNLISDHLHIAAYATLDKHLAILKYPYQLSVMSTWDDASGERWKNRWSEIK
jgi:hypothetical protein